MALAFSFFALIILHLPVGYHHGSPGERALPWGGLGKVESASILTTGLIGPLPKQLPGSETRRLLLALFKACGGWGVG